MGIFLPFSCFWRIFWRSLARSWKTKQRLCALSLLKCSFKLGSATKRNISWHLKNAQHGWGASGAALAFAGSHNQRTRVQSALIYCFAKLQWLHSHPAVPGIQEACVCWSRLESHFSYVKFVGLQSFHSLHMCKIILDYSFTARVPKSKVFYGLVLFWNVSPLLFFIFSLSCTLAVKLGRRRGQAHMRNI